MDQTLTSLKEATEKDQHINFNEMLKDLEKVAEILRKYYDKKETGYELNSALYYAGDYIESSRQKVEKILRDASLE